jgi:hypothetical protein
MRQEKHFDNFSTKLSTIRQQKYPLSIEIHNIIKYIVHTLYSNMTIYG